MGQTRRSITTSTEKGHQRTHYHEPLYATSLHKVPIHPSHSPPSKQNRVLARGSNKRPSRKAQRQQPTRGGFLTPSACWNRPSADADSALRRPNRSAWECSDGPLDALGLDAAAPPGSLSGRAFRRGGPLVIGQLRACGR